MFIPVEQTMSSSWGDLSICVVSCLRPDRASNIVVTRHASRLGPLSYVRFPRPASITPSFLRGSQNPKGWSQAIFEPDADRVWGRPGRAWVKSWDTRVQVSCTKPHESLSLGGSNPIMAAVRNCRAEGSDRIWVRRLAGLRWMVRILWISRLQVTTESRRLNLVPTRWQTQIALGLVVVI